MHFATEHDGNLQVIGRRNASRFEVLFRSTDVGDSPAIVSNYWVTGGPHSLSAVTEDIAASRRGLVPVERNLEDALTAVHLAIQRLESDWIWAVAEMQKFKTHMEEQCFYMESVPRPGDYAQVRSFMDELSALKDRIGSENREILKAQAVLFVTKTQYEMTMEPMPSLERISTRPPRPLDYAEVANQVGEAAYAVWSVTHPVPAKIAPYVALFGAVGLDASLKANQSVSYDMNASDLVRTSHKRVDVSSIQQTIKTSNELGKENPGEVQIIEAEVDGVKTFVVNIPGTQKWWWNDAAPHPMDTASNVVTVTGYTSTGMIFVMSAMERAGIGPNDNVILTGHSQGGAIAKHLATNAKFTNKYNVKAIITGSAPGGNAEVPSSIAVLDIENTSDLVPGMDGEENKTGRRQMTITADLELEEGESAHDLELNADIIEHVRRSNSEVEGFAQDIEKYLPSNDEVQRVRTYGVRYEQGGGGDYK